MSDLYNARVKVEQLIRERGLDEFAVKGMLSLRSGVLLSLLTPNTPDDRKRLEQLRAAVREVLKAEV